LRSALQEAGAGSGDVVSIIAPNSPSIFEAHFAVPASGAVLHSMNTRSDAHVIAFQMMHAKTKVLIVDSDHREVVQEAFKMIDSPAAELPVIVEVRDSENTHIKNLSDPQRSSTGATSHIYHQHERLTTYEEFLASGGGSVGVDGPLEGPIGEWDAISLNYTSGTTGNPKGVVCHHRGAYLNALANVVEWSMPQHARYLWSKCYLQITHTCISYLPDFTCICASFLTGANGR
jgi:fatty-acyl-CoA synthase